MPGPLLAAAMPAIIGGVASVAGDMLGKPSSQKQINYNNSSSKPSMWEDAQPGARQFYDYMRQILKTDPSYYQGATTAPISGATTKGWKTGLGAADAQDALFGQAMPAWVSALNAPDLENNQYVKDMRDSTRSQMTRSLREGALPAVAAGAAVSGGVGGSRQALAEALAIRDNQTTLGDTLNQLNLGAYGQGLQAQSAALGQTGAMGQAAGAGANTRLQVGQMQQAEQQKVIDDRVKRHDYFRDYPLQLAQLFSSAYAPMTPTGAKTTGQSGGRMW